jgi:patatin-related protein
MASTAEDKQPKTLIEQLTDEGFVEGDLQELRLGLVMTGGVSLAVWMGGTAHELNRLLRGDDPTYVELLKLTRTLPRIDVIAGTSAGGLNGALLAYAISQDSAVEKLRGLWLELGAFESLLRRPTVANPPSLMRGDDYFLPEIHDAIAQLGNRTTDPRDVPIELIITTTLLNAWPRGIPDSFGTIIQDADHRGEFTFRRGDDSEDGDGPRDDFMAPDIAHRLALAARCTASFPIAFEASFVPIDGKTDKPTRPDMKQHANFGMSRWVIDGGVLANQPLRPALRAIFRQPARRQVRRVLAFVVPDPGEAVQVAGDDAGTVPELSDVGLASMIRLPRNQSISAELDAITDHNAKVDTQRRQRELLVTRLDPDELAAAVYDHYRATRAEELTRWLFSLLATDFSKLELVDRKFVGEAPLRERARLREQLVSHLGTLPPDDFPTTADEAQLWFTTRDTAERAASVVLDLLRRGLAASSPDHEPSKDARERIRAIRGLVSEQLLAAQRLRKPPRKDANINRAKDALNALRSEKLPQWADSVLPEILGTRSDLRPIVDAIADQLQPAAAAVQEACAAPPAQMAPAAEEAAAFAQRLAAGVTDRASALRRLLALEVAQLALGADPTLEQRVELIQVSGDAGNGLDARERAEKKLAGLQVAHFGAFYKRSWRANDWMWGRHDAVQRLVQVLLDPRRLRQLGIGTAGALAEVQRIAFEGLTEDDERYLRTVTPRPWNPQTAAEELEFLDKPEMTPPATLPMCAQAIARRLQFGILQEELGQIAEAIGWDEHDGAAIPTGAQQFRDLYRAAQPGPLSAETATKLFGECKVGQEKIGNETSSDLLARTATQTLAVATSALSGEASGLPKPVREPLRTARGLALMIYLFVLNALSRQRAGSLYATAALAAGAALVGVGLFVDIPGILMVIGLGLLLGAVALAALRRKFWRLIGVLLLGLAIGIAPRVADWLTDDSTGVDEFVARIEPVVVVAGLLVAAYLLGRMSVVWPERDTGRGR